jgi:carbon storage regulator
MLVLSRKVGEEIVIGSEVVIGVARVSRNHVSLTIRAPMSVRVDRKEIHLAKNRDRRAAGLCESRRMPAESGEMRKD